MTQEEIKRVNINDYNATEAGLRDECKMIIKLTKYITNNVDGNIHFTKG